MSPRYWWRRGHGWTRVRPRERYPRHNPADFLTPERRALRAAERVTPRKASRTETETEVEEELEMRRGFPMTGGGDSSVSWYTDKLHSNAKQLGKLSMDTGRFFNVDNGYALFEAPYGLQQYATPCRALTSAEIREMFGQVEQHSGLDENEFRVETAGIYLKDLWLHLDIVNASNVAVYLEIMDIRPRKDIAANTDVINSKVDPAEFFYRGIDDLTGSTAYRNIMFVDPFMSRPFVEFFNVYKTTKVILAPGEYHTHRVHFAPNRLVNYREVSPFTTQVEVPDVLERLTYMPMIRFHGAPVIAKASVGSDFATYSACKLGMCWWSKVQFSFGMPFSDDLKVTNNLSTPVTAAETVLPTGDIVAVDAADP